MRGMPLLNDVTRDELMSMRLQGMSNKVIADALDVSSNTIRNIIGKQPPELRESSRHMGAYPARIKLVKPEPSKPEPGLVVEESTSSMLVIEKRTFKIAGMACNYIVSGGDIKFLDDQDNPTDGISFDSLDVFIEELKMILKHKAEMTAKNEQW